MNLIEWLFSYWAFDPNGYIRHLAIGAGLYFMMKLFKLGAGWIFGLLILIAMSKEIIDATVRGRFFSFMDIVFTMAPAIIFITITKIRT